MFNISELHQATILMDTAAFLLLIGIWVNTTIYRKRGHFDDVLYAQLIIITVIMAISDAISYVLDGGSVPHGVLMSMICNYTFFISFELFCGMLAVYFDHRVHSDTAVSKKRIFILMIPAIAMVLLHIANIFFKFLFSVDMDTNEYFQFFE